MIELNEPIEDAYFNWLTHKISRSRMTTPTLAYWNLLRELQNTEFVWIVPLDDNRAEDGKELRREFLRMTRIQIHHDWLDIPCSVFEMIVAFCQRATFQTGRSSREWFWEIMDNLGLSEFNDSAFDLIAVTDILYTLVWRTYDYHGNGGMFPIEHPKRDQRKIEIWEQFSEYLLDKYQI